MGSRSCSDRNSRPLSITRPFISIAAAAPVRHRAVGLVNLPGGIADAFAVIHAPAVDHAVLGGVVPDRRIAAVAGIASCRHAAKLAVQGRLLGPQTGYLRIIGTDLLVVAGFLGVGIAEQLGLLILLGLQLALLGLQISQKCLLVALLLSQLDFKSVDLIDRSFHLI